MPRDWKYFSLDSMFTCVGILFYLLDIGLDVWTVVDFYLEGHFVYLGLLLFFLLGCSVLAQIYSCLWYSYDDYRRTDTWVEGRLNRLSIQALHVFQLGLYLRYAAVFELSVRCFTTKKQDSDGFAVYHTHDLSMLRLIEAFSESAPQLVLMLTFWLRTGRLDLVNMLKALASSLAIALSVTIYQRSLRSFLLHKERQSFSSMVVYGIWNLLLISPRIAALALFAAVWPCFIFTHFLCSWTILVFFAWRLKTDFMDTAGGEWLYRATVGLIWYFSWFNVANGQTMRKSLVYHLCVLFDLGLLCGLSCWQVYGDPNYGQPSLVAVIMSWAVIISYLLGLMIKGIYYKFYHPKTGKDVVDQPELLVRSGTADVDANADAGPMLRSMDNQQEPVQRRENKRMRKLVEYFYT